MWGVEKKTPNENDFFAMSKREKTMLYFPTSSTFPLSLSNSLIAASCLFAVGPSSNWILLLRWSADSEASEGSEWLLAGAPPPPRLAREPCLRIPLMEEEGSSLFVVCLPLPCRGRRSGEAAGEAPTEMVLEGRGGGARRPAVEETRRNEVRYLIANETVQQFQKQ